MAIYHLTAKVGSRRNGANARSKAAYITRQSEYAWRRDLVHAESRNMPSWAAGHTDFWAAADKHEAVNGKLYYEIEFSLPRELTKEQQLDLARSFLDSRAQVADVAGSLPYTFAIHSPRQPHVHAVFNERAFDGQDRAPDTWFKRAHGGGARKTRTMQPKAWLHETRAAWATACNQALQNAGYGVRVDHRTLEAQGVTDRLPAPHVGPKAWAMEQRGVQTERGDLWREVQEANGAMQELREVEQQIAEERDRMGQQENGQRGLDEYTKEELDNLSPEAVDALYEAEVERNTRDEQEQEQQMRGGHQVKSFQEFRERYELDDDQVAVEEYQRYKEQLEIFGNIEESKDCETERWKRIKFTQTKRLPRM
jgi:hypothetical protein